MRRYQYDTTKFWTRWLSGSLLVWPLSLVIGGVLFVPIAFTLGSLIPALDGFGSNMSTREALFGGVVILIIGTAIGFSVGYVQRNIFRSVLYWTADGWTTASTIGGFAGAVVSGAVMYVADSPPNDTLSVVLMPVYIGCVGTAQWVTLRVATRSAWLWVLANIVGGLVFSGLMFRNTGMFFLTDGIGPLIMWAASAAAQGAITGYVILYLFERMAYPYDSTEMQTDQQGNSVWDNAI